jgi:hypothetical protein
MIFVDGHVHIYDCYDVDEVLDAAFANLSAAREVAGNKESDSSYVLLLVEGKKDRWFQRLQDAARKDGQRTRKISPYWHVELDCAEASLVAFRGESVAQKLYIACGQQIVSKEKIEVLSLFCKQKIENGLNLAETISTIQQFQGIAVLPWGVGKWMGKRGKRIAEILSRQAKQYFFLGDNGGRPVFWPQPALFDAAAKQGIAVLPGSDPLPLKNEANRVGSFGFYTECQITEEQGVLACLKQALQAPDIQQKVHPFGELQKNCLFVSNQLALRFSS